MLELIITDKRIGLTYKEEPVITKVKHVTDWEIVKVKENWVLHVSWYDVEGESDQTFTDAEVLCTASSDSWEKDLRVKFREENYVLS